LQNDILIIVKIGIDARLIRETGVGRYIRNLVLNLEKIDNKNSYVLFVRNEDIHNSEFIIHNSRFKTVEVNLPWHSLNEQLEFPKILYKESLDLVHFPYFSVPISYNKPFIVTIHDLIIHHFPTGKASTHPSIIYMFKILGYKYVISKACKNAKKIIAVSKSTKEEIVDHLKIPQDKIKVIYEGVDPKISNLKSQISNKSQNTKYSILNTKYFLFVGNVYPHKNSERMIKAFNIFLQYFPNAQLVFVGKEDFFYKRLKKMIDKMGLGKKIVFYGEVLDEELGALYKNAIAVVVPSLMEGFGLPALEAMANNCLVLASSIPSLKEVCGENAIYFDPYDIEDIAEKMKIAYAKNFDQKIIERGFERSKEFSFRKMAEETLKIYEQALNITG